MKKLYLVYPQKKGKIAPEVYGHFTEHIGGVFYDGLWVGKDSKIPNIKGFRKEIIEKLRAIKAPVIRWPGGCYAETYDWRDGIGENRPTRLNWWTAWDNRYEPNEVGTHEFCDLCEAVGAKAYRRQDGHSAISGIGGYLCRNTAFWSVWYYQRSSRLHTGAADISQSSEARL